MAATCLLNRYQKHRAAALAFERWRVLAAPACIAERIATLAAVGNAAGVTPFREIDSRFRQLAAGPEA